MQEQYQIETLQNIIEEQKIAISQISHEIRNPVTLINSSLQLIQTQHPEVKGFDLWDETMQDMEYLLRLLNDVSHYNNGILIHTEALDVRPWLLEIADSIKRRIHPSLQFACQIPAALPVIQTDALKLRQAISNLLRNAFEALGEEGTVTLSAHADHSTLLIQIADTGCGIPAEYQDTLFCPFVTHKPNGTGLGLLITQRIVNAHGGSLTFDTSPKRGTVFTIRLPIR